jgi:hypothetical protein
MQKSLCLALTVGFTLSACTGSKPKTTWQKVTETRPDKVASGEDASQAYVEKLQKVLAADKVEHRVVTYQYRYETRLRDEAVGTGVAVLYKDNSDPANPWWLMSDRLHKPVWLPGQDMNNQVSFYLRRTAQVIEHRDYIGGEPLFPQSMVAKAKPVVPAGEPAVTQIAKAQPAPAAAPAVAQTAPRPFARPARFAPVSSDVKIPFTAPSGGGYETLFRRAHGTTYDPSSPVDRQKMETIKAG